MPLSTGKARANELLAGTPICTEVEGEWGSQEQAEEAQSTLSHVLPSSASLCRTVRVPSPLCNSLSSRRFPRIPAALKVYLVLPWVQKWLQKQEQAKSDLRAS